MEQSNGAGVAVSGTTGDEMTPRAGMLCQRSLVATRELAPGILSLMEHARAHYLGTEVDGVWHRRYRTRGFFARGLGEYWVDGEWFWFRRYLTRAPFSIPLREIRRVELGAWHAGRWVVGDRAVKLVWEKDGRLLSSGFVLSRTAEEAAERANQMRDLIARFR